ncbi:hypothetical protein VPH35_018893 [Triticum aestivum]|uniref:RNase H type-1 domain-containing protein n=1 Tax=Triticum turgidum subsp. durum TaxID=4567 RepID=A0A9R1R2N6_TRITD|nr:unnamed protein product [Triticum turgidum subsp. durum]
MEKERMEPETITSVHVMIDYLWGLDIKKRLHVLTFWWLWWLNGNKLKEGKMPLAAAEVARWTRSNVLEYLHIFGEAADKATPERWRPSVESDYKINVDGSFVPGQHHAGWGVAVRSKERILLCARAGRSDNVSDAFVAEAVAMSHAINRAVDLGLVQVELETDSQLLAEALDLRKVDSLAYAAVIKDMKYQLKL